jgi:spore germination protein GerM
MQDKQQSRRFSFSNIAGVSLLVLALGTTTALLAKYNLDNSSKQQPSLANQTQVESNQTADSKTTTNKNSDFNKQPTNNTVKNPDSLKETIEVYWIDNTGTQIVGTLTTISSNKSNNKNERELLEDAFNMLLSGPTDKSYTTTIPAKTKLLSLKSTKQGIRINLSQEFTDGGGSNSQIGRLGQIIYTATSLNPQGQVWIDIEGKPLEVLGGEGLMVEQPITRQIFEKDFLSEAQ